MSFRAFTLPMIATAIALPFAATAADSTVTLDEAAAVPFPRLIYSFNTQLLAATTSHSVTYGGDVIDSVVEELKPYGLRFPGGTVGNNYVWKEDSFSLQKGDLTKWAAKQFEIFRKSGKKYDIEGFARLCNTHNIEPIYVLNVFEETPESVVELLEHFDSIDLKVRFIELANEPYWDPRSHNDVEAYMNFCRPLVAAIREKNPDIKIGACFGPVDKPGNYEEIWNAPLAKEDWYDAVVYHEYYGGQGFAMEAGTSMPVEAMLHPDAFVAEVVEAMEEAKPGLPIWFTEWNIGSQGLKEWKNTGAELLFIAAATQQIFVHNDVFEWSCFHQLWSKGFGLMDWNKDTAALDTTASYQLFELMGATLDGAEKLIPSTIGDSKGALALTVTGSNGPQLLVINRSAEPLTLTLPDNPAFSQATAATIQCGPPLEKLPINTDLIVEAPVSGANVELPPYSVSRIFSK